MRSWFKKQTPTNRDQAQRQDSGSVADGPRKELLTDTDALGLQRLLADLHRPPVVFMPRNDDIKAPAHMVIHDAITNDSCSTIDDHACPNQNAENRYPMGTGLQNGVLLLTKTPFAGLHHR
jgi:hypothetical protein